MTLESIGNGWAALSARHAALAATQDPPAAADATSEASQPALTSASTTSETLVSGGQQAVASLADMSPAEQAEGTGLMPIDADLAALSDHVYGGGGVLPPGWTHVDSPEELAALGVSEQEVKALGLEWRNGFLVDPETGLQAGFYVHVDGTVTLAFAGTDPGDFSGDWETNFDQAAFDVPPAYEKAIELSITLDQGLTETGRDDALVLTGHSMGGGLAVAGGYATGATAVSFNGAGLRDGTIEHALERRRERLGEDPGEDAARQSARDGRVRHVYVEGDPLTTVQDLSLFSLPGAYLIASLARLGPILGLLSVSGAVVVLTLPAADDGTSLPVSPPDGTGVHEAHGIDTVIAGVLAALPVQTTGTDPITGAPIIAQGNPAAWTAYQSTNGDPEALAIAISTDDTFADGEATMIVSFTQDAPGDAARAYFEKTGKLPPDNTGVASVTTVEKNDGVTTVETRSNTEGVLATVETATVSRGLESVEPAVNALGIGPLGWPYEATLTVVRGADGQPVSATLDLDTGEGTTLQVSYVFVDGTPVVSGTQYTFIPDEHEARDLNLLYYGTEDPESGGFIAGQFYTLDLDPAQAEDLLGLFVSMQSDHPIMTHYLRNADPSLNSDGTAFRVLLAHFIDSGALFEILRLNAGDGGGSGTPITILDADGNVMPTPATP